MKTMLKPKIRRKARRIAVSEIMMPAILIIVLGITTIVLTCKLVRLGKLLSPEDSVEKKWIINLGVVMIYSVLDLAVANFLYGGVKQSDHKQCRIWVTLQMVVLFLFTIAVLKCCNATAVGFHFFELMLLYVCVLIYKIHHIAFVYGLIEKLKLTQLKKSGKEEQAVVETDGEAVVASPSLSTRTPSVVAATSTV